MQVGSMGREDPLAKEMAKEMATHSGIGWKISWTVEQAPRDFRVGCE